MQYSPCRCISSHELGPSLGSALVGGELPLRVELARKEQSPVLITPTPAVGPSGSAPLSGNLASWAVKRREQSHSFRANHVEYMSRFLDQTDTTTYVEECAEVAPR